MKDLQHNYTHLHFVVYLCSLDNSEFTSLFACRSCHWSHPPINLWNICDKSLFWLHKISS